MRTYEAVFIYDPRISDEERNKITEKIEGVISSNGTLHETSFWGKRRFAYPIQKSTEGYYYLFIFDAPPTLPTELKRITAITETIFRSMVIARKYRYIPKETAEEPEPLFEKEVKPTPIEEPKPVMEELLENSPEIESEETVMAEFISEEQKEEADAE